MDVQVIECALIDVPKSNELRTFKKEFAIKLADSIRVEGQLCPISVRPNQLKKGRYLLVAGKHRLYAIKQVLKEQFIACNVITDMDEEDAEMAMIAENLWRNPLTKAQHALCIKKWLAHYLRKHPGKVRNLPVDAEDLAKDEKAEEQAEVAAEDNLHAEAETSTQSEAEEEGGNFAETVAAATGQSVDSAKRAQRLATAFTEEELECFHQMSVSQTDMLTIARIKDLEKRAQVVRLIAAGQTPQEAIKAVMGENAPAKHGAYGKEAQKARDEAKQSKSPDLADDEWYAEFCAEKGKCYANEERYKRDAVLYRKIIEARHVFRQKVKKLVMDEIGKEGPRPVFANLLNRVIAVSHPKDWLICEGCRGKAVVGGKNCGSCFGAGYKLKLEEYV